jgi:integrase
MLQTLLYTGVRVSEPINIKITDVNFNACQIQIQKGVKGQQRVIFFPATFKDVFKKRALGIQTRSGGSYAKKFRHKMNSAKVAAGYTFGPLGPIPAEKILGLNWLFC